MPLKDSRSPPRGQPDSGQIGGLAIARLDALQALHQHGAHFVLAHLVPNQKGGYRKPPCYPGWQHSRPSFDLVQLHERRGPGMLLGMIPASIGNSALDVDKGDPTELIAETNPHTHYRTRRTGGHHLWYSDTEERHTRQWRLFGCSGELKSRADGFMILWGDAPQRLVSALVLDLPPSSAFPADLFDWAGVPLPPLSDTVRDGEPECAPGPAGDSDEVGDWKHARADLENVYQGRTHSLFNVLRKWAYVQPFQRYGLEKWVTHVERRSVTQDQRFPFPLGEREAVRIGYNVATWTWHVLRFSRDPESQAAHGVASGRVRRQQVAGRDARIVALSDTGLSQRRIVAALQAEGLYASQQTVGYVLARERAIQTGATRRRRRPEALPNAERLF